MISILYWLQENWKDVIEAASAVTVAVCAVCALYTWRKEFVGKKKIEFAAEFVEKAIDIKGLIAYVRNGYSFANEKEEIENELKKENKFVPNGNVAYLVPKYRILKNDENIRSFHALRTKAFMYFGKSALKIYDVVISDFIKIKLSSEALYKNSYYNYLKDEKEKQDIAVIWASYNSDDKIDQEIEKVVEELKLNLEPLYQDKTFKWKTLK